MDWLREEKVWDSTPVYWNVVCGTGAASDPWGEDSVLTTGAPTLGSHLEKGKL